MHERCDGDYDCSDRSDERNCQIARIDEDIYRKDQQPKGKDKNATLLVTAQITIYRIEQIQELDGDCR